ncbi:MAG: hypothetical protein Q9164_003841 [Protoblastenia rupestris]
MDDDLQISIQPARASQDLQDVQTLFAAYAAWLAIDLSFQGFAAELGSLPGKYAPPRGEILLARDRKGLAIGCVAVRPLGQEGCYCEMKRLYTLPEVRGQGVGRRLVEAIVDVSIDIGYTELRLDTLENMTGAISLYQVCGFFPIDAYYETPLDGTVFLARKLS